MEHGHQHQHREIHKAAACEFEHVSSNQFRFPADCEFLEGWSDLWHRRRRSMQIYTNV